MDQAKLVGDILENWANIAPERQTVVFATNVAHSKHIRDEFIRMGVAAEHVDAHTPSEDRDEILDRFRTGVTQVVTNVGVYSEGADFPWCSCIVLARPSKSYGRFVQYAGRGLRPYPGKKDCIVIDHAGLVNEHGFLEDPVYWTLDDDEKAWKKAEPRVREKTIHECKMCMYIFVGPRCPQCGTRVKDYLKKIATTDDELERLNKPKTEKATMEEKAEFYGMAKYYARDKGYKEGWCSQKYKSKFGVWPNKLKRQSPIIPDTGFLNYIKHLNIKWAKSKSNPRNQK
jgi:superfamily II DNA or RNA helicase